MAEECGSCKSAIGLPMRRALLFTLSAVSALAQEPLKQQIRAIASEAHGKVSVACSLPGSILNCDLDPNARPPMQSVFKLPLALTVLYQVEKGTLSLDQPLPTGPKPERQNPEDFIERSQSRSWMLSFQEGELSKNEIFQQKSAASMQTPENGCHQRQKYAKHAKHYRARSMTWLMRDSVTISFLCNASG